MKDGHHVQMWVVNVNVTSDAQIEDGMLKDDERIVDVRWVDVVEQPHDHDRRACEIGRRSTEMVQLEQQGQLGLMVRV